jgi:hypothetical protein
MAQWRHWSGREADLVGYWSFDEGEGTVAHDAGPHGLHARFVSGSDPAWVPAVSKPLNDVSNLLE